VSLPSTWTHSGRQSKCPLCRVCFAPGSTVPNWSLRDSASTSGSARYPALPSVPAQPAASPPVGALEALHIPPGLARLAREEAQTVGLRLFLLDNSGSTETGDGHRMHGLKVVSCTRWQEIVASACSAAALGAATGIPCEFHLLNPLRGSQAESPYDEGIDFIRTCGAQDGARLENFLNRVRPCGVTPLAERLSSLEPRLAAFRRDSPPGNTCFLILFTDGAPTPTYSGTPTAEAAQSALRTLRRLTCEYPVRLVCRLCTDESSAVDFWNSADSEVEVRSMPAL